jgi:DNA-binding MarR family transcriptional regulator
MPRRNPRAIALLADPTRLRIVALLAERPRRPSVVAAELGISRPSVSRHLRQLEEAGLVVRTRSHVDRRAVLLLLDPRQVRPILAWLAATGLGGPAPASDDGIPPVAGA